MPQARIPVEPVQGLRSLRLAKAREGPKRQDERQSEEPQPHGAPERRRIEPEAEPGDGEKQNDDGEGQPQARPGLLPPESKPRAPDQTIQPSPKMVLLGHRPWAFAHAIRLPSRRQPARDAPSSKLARLV